MSKYTSKRNFKLALILFCLVLLNIVGIYLTRYVLSYTVLILIQIMLVVFDVYELYYIISTLTIKYEITGHSIIIRSFLQLRDVEIRYEDIVSYKISKGNEEGVKLSGFTFGDIVVGRAFIKNLGLIRMYVTTDDKVIYIMTKNINYAITPNEIEDFIKFLEENNFPYGDKIEIYKLRSNLHRDKYFMIPFCIVAIVCGIMVTMPIYFYLKGQLPYTMPLSFDINFNPIKIGTGKQFAFQQMIYGGLNLALLFCMYFAAHFNAKYDKKSAYKYIYIALIVSLTFLLTQIKIFISFL